MNAEDKRRKERDDKIKGDELNAIFEALKK